MTDPPRATTSIHWGSPIQREGLSSLLPLVLRLEVIHQLVLSHETIHALTTAVANRAIQVLGASLVAFLVAIEVARAAKAQGTADVRTVESTIERGGSAAGDGQRSVARVVLCGRHGHRTEHTRMIGGSDVVRVIAYEGGSICVVHVRRCDPVRFKGAWEVDLHVSIEALLIGANKVAAAPQTNHIGLVTGSG